MKVSVVITVYNGNWCIERALDSVLGQTRPVHEVLVCDDGSTDGTPDLVEDRYGPPIRVLRFPHRNATACRSDGLERATGDWLAFMDADDAWFPEKNERQIEYLESHPSVRWIGTNGELFGRDGVILDDWFSQYFDQVQDISGDVLPQLVERCFPLLSSMMVQAEAYHAVGGLDHDIHRAYDYDLWLRLAGRYPGAFLAERLIRYWTGPGTLSKDLQERARQDLMVLRKVVSGASVTDRRVRKRAAERVAALEFDLALKLMRGRRYSEARTHLRAAWKRGPLQRRLLALGGSLLPDPLLRRIVLSQRLKTRVRDSRERVKTLSASGAEDAS